MLTPEMEARWRQIIAYSRTWVEGRHPGAADIALPTALVLVVDAELTRLRALVDDEEDILPPVGTPASNHRSVGRKVSSRASPALVIEGLEER